MSHINSMKIHLVIAQNIGVRLAFITNQDWLCDGLGAGSRWKRVYACGLKCVKR